MIRTHVVPPRARYAHARAAVVGTNITLIPLVVAVSVWLIVKRKRAGSRRAPHDRAARKLDAQLVLKEIFDRPRPELFEKRGQHAWAAFPSGHAIASVSVLLTVAILLRREQGWRWPMPVAVILLLISLYSRVYLGVHWPTDIVGGVLVGLLWLGATYTAFRGPVVPARDPGAGRSPAPGE